MNKGKNCFFAILVFGLTMAVFNGMSVVLAVSASIGGGIIQGANGVNMTYDYLMDHMNFYSVLVYLIPLAIFGLWYYFAFVDQKGTENSLSVKIKKLDITGCLILVVFTFSIQHVTSLVMAVINQLFPQAMETYTEMIDSSGITEYSLMWVVSTLILPPLVEEMIFRGLIMGYLRNRNALDDRQCDPGSLLRHFSSKFSSGNLCRASRTGTWICSVSLWNTICIYADASAL